MVVMVYKSIYKQHKAFRINNPNNNQIVKFKKLNSPKISIYYIVITYENHHLVGAKRTRHFIIVIVCNCSDSSH